MQEQMPGDEIGLGCYRTIGYLAGGGLISGGAVLALISVISYADLHGYQ